MNFLKCRRNEKIYRHALMIINFLFEIKKFTSLNFFKILIVIKIFLHHI